VRHAFGRALIAVALALATVAAQSQQTQRPRQHGLFPPKDLGLLDPPDRDTWQRPDQIMDALGIADASIVADVGAGSGWFTVRIARRVGPNGIVYAQDVQQEMLAAISRRVQREGLTNVRTVLGQGSDPNLPRGRLDAILVVGVYHEIDDRVTMLRNLAAALKPQGRIGVIDFKLNGDGGPGPALEERVDPQIVLQDAEKANLRLLSQESFLPYQYCLIFGRANAPPTSTPSGAAHSRAKPLPGRPR
jgi:SAM-dependent methyltransferase